jgi:hypothetical protein
VFLGVDNGERGCTAGYAITQRTPCGATGGGKREKEGEGYAIAQRTPIRVLFSIKWGIKLFLLDGRGRFD